MSNSFSYETAFKKFLYPAYNKLVGRDGNAVFKERRKTQYLDYAAIEKIQLDKLKRVLVNAKSFVPYYRSEFSRIGFIPEDLKSIHEFRGVEFFIDKSIVRDNVKEFLADNSDRSKLNWHRTGGSTGTPLYFPTDRPTDAASASALIKSLDWWGIEIGARHAMFWGSPTFISRKKLDVVKQWGNRVRNRLMNRVFFLNYDLGEHNLHNIYNRIESFKPVYIRGMPTSLAIFAKIMEKNNLRLDKGRPKFIHSACEQLYDWQKEIVEDRFGAPLLNTYGLSEVADIAYEAPCGNLHIMDEDVLVELFPFMGGEKEIVTTQLNNMASPLIRYRTGDIAESVEKCHCQLHSNILVGLKGRAHDFIVAPGGRFLHGQFLTHIIVYETGILKYQAYQKAVDRLDIKLVVSDGYEAASQDRMRSAIQSYMGRDVQINFSIVDDIPLTIAGKHRWIISELGPLGDHI